MRRLQYSFLLTKRDHWDLADEVLRHILLSNAYQSRELQDMIRLTLISESTSASTFSFTGS
jgi:general transcription factor 3C polypeptide 3 (transcription factor C subunit 4)